MELKPILIFLFLLNNYHHWYIHYSEPRYTYQNIITTKYDLFDINRNINVT